MQIDLRLNDIDDCLYRVAARALIMHKGKILLVKEASDNWWTLPGGGVDHGETVKSALTGAKRRTWHTSRQNDPRL